MADKEDGELSDSPTTITERLKVSDGPITPEKGPGDLSDQDSRVLAGRIVNLISWRELYPSWSSWLNPMFSNLSHQRSEQRR